MIAVITFSFRRFTAPCNYESPWRFGFHLTRIRKRIDPYLSRGGDLRAYIGASNGIEAIFDQLPPVQPADVLLVEFRKPPFRKRRGRTQFARTKCVWRRVFSLQMRFD